MLIRKIIILIAGFGVLNFGIGQEKVGTIAEEPVSTDSVAPVLHDTLSIKKGSEKPSTDTITKAETPAAKDTVIELEAVVTETVAPVDSSKVSDSGATIELPGDDDIIMVDGEEPVVEGDSLVDTLPPIETMPELKEFVEAEYPEEIYKRGIEGSVLMELIVSDSGIVDSVSLIKGIHPILDSSAMKAARQFVFTPAMAGGENVAVLIRYEYHFELKEIVKKVEKYVNFSGVLIERGTKKPIADAMVVIHFIDTLSDTTLPVPFSVYLNKLGTFEGQYLEENRLVSITDSLGQFSFYSLPLGNIEITAPLPGYEKFKEQEYISADEALEVNYYIRRISYSDYEIVVYGKTEKKEVSRRKLTINEVKKIPGLGGDAVKVVQALPGVARPTMGSGQVIVRGAPTWDSQFYLDGIPIPQLYHFGGIKSTYNSEALESVDFYPGGFGTRYGNSIAGIVEITGRAPKKDRFHGYLDGSFQDLTFLVEGPVNSKLSVMGAARRSIAGDILSYVFENSDLNMPFTISPFYWDYQMRVDYDVNKEHHLYLTGFGSKDKMVLIYPSIQGGSEEVDEFTDRMRHMVQFHMGILGHDWQITDKLKNRLRFSLLGGKYLTSIFGFMKWTGDYFRTTIRNELAFNISEKLIANFGIDALWETDDMILMIPDAFGVIAKDTINNWKFGDVAAYVNFEWKPFEQLQIIPGLRYDYFRELLYDGSVVPEFWEYKDFDNSRGISGDPSIRVTTRYDFVKDHTAKFAIGNYNQTPQPGGQVIHEKWGEPQMPSTKARHIVFGHEWQITDLIRSDIQFYFNKQWDIPRQASRKDLVTNADKKWYDDGEGKMRGLEVMLRHDQGERFFGWLAYTLSLSERWNPNEGKWELFRDDETHHIQALGSFRLRRSWDIGFRARYVTGKPITPVIGAYEDAEFNQFIPEYGDKNSKRLDPFFQLDLRVDKKFVFDKWIFSLYLDMQNVSYFVYKSPEFEVYNYDYSDKQTASYIFFPAFGIKAEF